MGNIKGGDLFGEIIRQLKTGIEREELEKQYQGKTVAPGATIKLPPFRAAKTVRDQEMDIVCQLEARQ